MSTDPLTVSTGRVDVPASKLFEALSDEDRLTVLSYLADRPDESARVSDLAAHLAPADDRAELRLHHVVLPKLADLGLVDYDPERRRVSLSEAVPGDAVAPRDGDGSR